MSKHDQLNPSAFSTFDSRTCCKLRNPPRLVSPVTTGKFETPAGADDFNEYSSTTPAPPFPGEDFLVNAPEGVTFPTDLRGMTIVVSVEPVPDNSPAPFLLKPLRSNVSTSAVDRLSILMSNNAAATNPTGVVTK